MAAYWVKIINNSGKTLKVSITKPGTAFLWSGTMFVGDSTFAYLADGTRVVNVVESLTGNFLYATPFGLTGEGSLSLGSASAGVSYSAGPVPGAPPVHPHEL